MARVLRTHRVTVIALVLTLLGACASAPPKLAPPHLRDDVPLAGLQAPTRDGWPPSQWWRQYHDPELDQLMALAMQQAPDLALARSRVEGAQQSARLAAAQMGLSINGTAQISRKRLSEHGFIPTRFLGFTWYNQADLGVQLEYDFDWWGKKRASIEAALDQAHAARAQQSAAALALQYAVANTYFGWQTDQARLSLATQMLTTQQKLAKIAGLRVRQGVDLADTLEEAKARLAGARQRRVGLEGAAAIQRTALASLVGVSPDKLPSLKPRPLPSVKNGLPPDAGLDLIARRPDIAASRWQVEAALKKTDVARAQFFPDFGITALAGLSSIDLGKLLTAGSRTFELTPALHLPIFEGGQLQANYGLSKAQLDSAIAEYNRTVLSAAREVSTQALSAENIQARRHEQASAISADEQLLRNATARRRQGVTDARESLAAQAQLLQERDAGAQLKGQAVSTDLSLIKALGGGYRRPVENNQPSLSPGRTGAESHESH